MPQSAVQQFMFHNNYTQEEYCSYHVILPADPETGNGELILGDLNAATDEQLMREHQVKTIITAATGLEHLQIPAEQTHVVFPLLDLKTENIESYFELSNQTIDENLKKGSVLVHCGAGISRSATLVIAYYMKKYNTGFGPAIKHVRKCRPNVCPNLGFQLQLKHYQTLLGLKQKNSISQKESVQLENKKQFLETKPMLLTFQAPFQGNKSSRMANTHKNFGQFTPSMTRKTANHSRAKKKVEGDLQIIGRQAEMSENGLQQHKNKGWGQRIRDNRSFKY